MSRDRRRHPRLKFELNVDVACGHSLFNARTVDISEGGVFIKTSAAIAIGTEVCLRLKLGFTTITAIGEVVWRVENEPRKGIGVQFKSLSPYAKDSLRRFMRKQAPFLDGAPPKVVRPPRPDGPRSTRQTLPATPPQLTPGQHNTNPPGL